MEGSASSVIAGSWGHKSCLSGGQSPQPTHTMPRMVEKQEIKSLLRRMCGMRNLAGKLRRPPSFSPGIRGMFSPVPCDLYHLVLDVLSESLLERLSNHGDLVPSEKRKKK